MAKNWTGIKSWTVRLDTLLKEIDQSWLESLIKEYREGAERDLQRMVRFLETSWEDLPKNRYGEVQDPLIPGAQGFYARIKKPLQDGGWKYRLDNRDRARNLEKHSTSSWFVDEERPATIEDFEVDYERAEEDARRFWREARNRYIWKNAEKLSQATEGLQEPQIECSIRLTRAGLVEGWLYLTFPNGDVLRTKTSLKWNRSVNWIYFAQYPTLFWLEYKGYKESRKSVEWLAKNFAQKTPEERALPVRVEDLKTMSSLAYTLTYREDLEAHAAKRRAQGYMYDTKGPQGQITRMCNKLGLPKDLTAEEAMSLLVRSIPQDLWDTLCKLNSSTVYDKYQGKERKGAEKAPAGKKGKSLRDAYKALEKMELVSRRDVVAVREWGQKVAEVMG